MANDNPDMSGLTPFEKGKTGNPNGRPKGKVSLERAIKLIMETPTEYIDPVTGRMMSGHYVDKHLAELIELSKIPVTEESKQLTAKLGAIKELNDRYGGKAKQVIEMVESQAKKYDFNKLTPEQQIEFDAVQTRYSELLTLCEIPMDENEG